jgi:DNA-directed RNA polymerase subunit RPC12/RpoP
VVVIKCVRCKQKIFKYEKIGKGRIWHCWKHRIKEDYSIHKGTEIRCSCGNLIGIVEGKWIKMKQNAFEFSGAITKR